MLQRKPFQELLLIKPAEIFLPDPSSSGPLIITDLISSMVSQLKLHTMSGIWLEVS